jgi:hypothetical protein
MQQPQVMVYADIGEVRMETRTAECNRLLAQGWVLLGMYRLTTVGEMEEEGKGVKQQEGQLSLIAFGSLGQEIHVPRFISGELAPKVIVFG